jgi:hypothetical protein
MKISFIHMKNSLLTIFISSLLLACNNKPTDLFVEAESFATKGGWVVNQQFMDLMGSPYLMAHGMGIPVEDASATVKFPKTGIYRLFVRTYNWTAPWLNDKGPGKFQVLVNDKPIEITFGDEGNTWLWQDGGLVEINSREVQISLHDLTGFDGRCDAFYFTQDTSFVPPAEKEALTAFRYQQTGIVPEDGGSYDLVVIGGGIGGICTAVSAARLGSKVALIQDRPVYGGNNSSEVRVHLGGRIGLDPYPALGGIVKEISPMHGGNAQPGNRYEDEKKSAVVSGEPNISQYLNYHAFKVEMDGNKIKSVTAKHIETGKELVFTAPLFVDCTGDATIGALAGADFAMGRESKAEFGESIAPEVGDKMTMGSSVQWYSEENNADSTFPVFSYGVDFNETNAQKVTMGEWTWETGMHLNQITDFERIRDYGLLVVYSNWSFLKNGYSQKDRFANRSLGWVAYVAGKRESRRLLGDIILRQQDMEEQIPYPDATACVTWSIDLHYPDPENSAQFPGNEFRSICEQPLIHPYPVPYRCMYSRNINNLFMTGRNMSVTHTALGTTRQMRSIGMFGEVIGMAASICKQHNVLPRSVYENHLDELISLMKKGVGKEGTADYPQYNLGETLDDKKINP